MKKCPSCNINLANELKECFECGYVFDNDKNDEDPNIDFDRSAS